MLISITSIANRNYSAQEKKAPVAQPKSSVPFTGQVNTIKLQDFDYKMAALGKGVSFGKSIKDHTKYYGANYDPKTQKTDFRVWAEKDSVDFKKGVVLEVITPEHLKKEPELRALTKDLRAEIPEKFISKGTVQQYKLSVAQGKDDVLEAIQKDIPPGSLYRLEFQLSKDNPKLGGKKGDTVHTNDPRAYYLPSGVNGWASVIDDTSYKFKNPRPTFDSKEPVLIYEANIAAATKNGNFESFVEKIDEIKEDGYTHIQLMPLGQSVGKGWGYAALPYAISNELCSGKENPDDFKKMVDACHEKGLGVIIDVNHNHFTEGFLGNYLGQYSSKGPETDWGDAYNYENANVRDFAIDDLVRFVTNYNIDGFRFDSTHCIENGVVRQINLELEGHSLKGDFGSDSKILTISEDYNMKPEGTQKLTPQEIATYYTNWQNFDYAKNNASNILGLDATVNLDSHHLAGNIVRGIKNTSDGSINGAKASNIERIFQEGKSFSSYPTDRLVSCLSAHDDIQDMSGTRLVTKGIITALNMEENVNVDPKFIKPWMDETTCKRRHASNVVQELLEEYTKSGGQLPFGQDQMNMGIKKPITKANFEKALQDSRDLAKVAITEYLLSPGKYKMNFMGDEKGVISPFKFFMDSSFEDTLENTSDFYMYNIRPDSALGKSNLEQEYKNEEVGIKNFYKEALKLFKNNEALKYRDGVERYWNNDGGNVFEVGYQHGDKKIYAVLNLGNDEFESYGIQLTKGNWKEALNSDKKDFGGSGEYLNTEKTFTTDGAIKDWGNTLIKLAPRSVVILEST